MLLDNLRTGILAALSIIIAISIAQISWELFSTAEIKSNDTDTNATNLTDSNMNKFSRVNFLFAYTRANPISGDVLYKIWYDSNTKEIFYTDLNYTIKRNILADSIQQSLISLINQSGFFNAENTYPQNILTFNPSYYLLTVKLNGNIHTVSWTSANSAVPLDLYRIADSIEKVVKGTK